MRRSYPRGRAAAKPDAAEFKASLEEVCRARISELLQAILEAEVDEALERLRYERRGGSKKPGYRDGHDRQRTITSNRGPIDVKRPRVRGTSFSSAVLPKHKRRLRDVDASLTELWLDGLATRDFRGHAASVSRRGRAAVGCHDHAREQAACRRVCRLEHTPAGRRGLGFQLGRRRVSGRRPR